MKRQLKPFNLCLVDMENGVGRAFCTTRCLTSWLRWWSEKIGDRYHLGYPTNQIACQHCWMCGERTNYDGQCVLHDDGCCPEKDWSHTSPAIVLSQIVTEVLSRPLEDADLYVMEKVYGDRDADDYPWELAMKAVDIIRAK